MTTIHTNRSGIDSRPISGEGPRAEGEPAGEGAGVHSASGAEPGGRSASHAECAGVLVGAAPLLQSRGGGRVPPSPSEARALSTMNHHWDPNLKDKALGVGMLGMGLSWMVPFLGGLTALQEVFPADRLDLLNRLFCRGTVALTGTRWRTVVHPDLDPTQAYMFAQNHVNQLDHVTFYPATPHFKQGMELESHFKYPIYGRFMKSRGTIGVKRGEGRQMQTLIAKMRAEVDRGHSLLVFPEGTRTRTGHVGPFRKGIFYAAVALGIPIVPVAVTGMFEVMRPGSWVIRPGHEVTVYVEAPIPTAGLTRKDVSALSERVHDIIAARVDAYYGEENDGTRSKTGEEARP